MPTKARARHPAVNAVADIAATVLLGVAAVLIAWSTYQAQLWGGVQDSRNTESALTIVEATDDLGRADSDRSLDQLLFVDP